MERLTTNMVPFDGPLEAEMCFLGEAPGEQEDNALKPFVGAAGQLLDRCFRTVGIARGEVLLGNIFKQRPPKNKINYYFQDAKCTKPTWEGEEHIASLKKWLEKRKEEGNINVLVALGAVPTFILTGRKRITKWRGSVLPCTLVEGFKVYCCFHPSYVNRLMNEPEERLLGEKKKQQQNALPLFLRDLERVIEQSGSPDFKPPEREFRIIENAQEAINELSLLSGESHVAVDIETLFSDEGPLHWCIGFSPRPDYAFIIPFLKGRKFFWSLPEETRVLQAISRLFLNPGVKKIFHNCLFDLSVLGRYYGLRCASGSVEDSMLCYHASYPYLKKALETLTSIYTWENYYKDDGKVWDGRRISDEAEFIYNGRDCCVTREIWPLVERDAKELGTWEGYRRTMSVIPSLLAMQIRGVKINTEKKGELQQAFGEKVVEAEKLLVESTGQSWNLNSSPQMIRLVYGYLGLSMQYNHKTKKPTTDKDALNRLRRKHPENKVLKAIVDHRKFAKLSSTYAKMKVEKDERIRTSYQLISTYRLSSSESIFGGGGNLQNIPVRTTEGKLVRSLFIPDKGKVLLASDLSQAEARVVAWLSNDTRLIEAFTAGEDVHWLNAQMIFQIPNSVNYLPKAKWRDNFTGQEHPLKFYRDLAKSIVYASSYGMGFNMLQTILIREEVYFQAALCKRLLHQYKTNNPMLTSWQNNTKEEVRATRTLISPSPFNRKRVFRGRLSDNLFRSALAFRPQSVVGEILEVAIQKIHTTSKIFTPLLNVHDEVVGQCLPIDLPTAMAEAKSALEIPLQINNKELTIPCDFKTGSDWGNLKEIKFSNDSKNELM
jgi:DNA polymerase-1